MRRTSSRTVSVRSPAGSIEGEARASVRRVPCDPSHLALFTGLVALLVIAGATLVPSVVSAQSKEPVRIGVLTVGWGPTPATVGLRDGLQALGYREDEHFHIGVRFTQGDVGALPTAARELLAAGSDIIFAASTNAARAAQQATKVTPIVFGEVIGDPVKLGLVRSFARPGGNITGVSTLAIELTSKRLELFKELVPGLKRVLLVYDPNDSDGVTAAEAHREAARQLGIVLIEKTPRSQEEARDVITRVRRDEVDGIVVSPSGMALNIPGVVLEAASRKQVPTMFNAAFWVERGALAGYGPDFYESGRQAARLVVKILKGEKPEGIPVETNSRIELVINLKVAKALKLELGQAVLQRAHRLIE
jgi:putative ABC transport system substrate-binding protein